MATLSDINKTLVSQNQNLEGIDFSIDKLSGNINKLIDNLTGLDNLEKEREKNQEKADKAKEKAESKSGSGGGVGGFTNRKLDFGSMFSAGGLLGAGAALGGFLLKRGLPALILNSLADNIADYVEGETGSKELGDALYRGIKLGSIGLLLGKRFGLIGAAIGVLLTDENKKKLEEMGANFGELKTKFENMFNISLPSADTIITGITTTFGEAIDGINAILTGDWEGIKENVGSLVLTVGGLFALFRPGKAIALAIKALIFPFAATTRALKWLTRKPPLDPPEVPKTGGRGTLVPTAAEIDEMRNRRNRATPDSKGNVRSKSGRVYSATSPQGQAITQGFRETEAKFNKQYSAEQKAMKNPRFAKFAKALKGFGALGAVVNTGLLAMILMDENLSAREKMTQGGGLLSGIAGTAVGGAIGGLIFGPIGAGLGSIGGYFAGDYLGQKLVEWMLGKNFKDFDAKTLEQAGGAGRLRRAGRRRAGGNMNLDESAVAPPTSGATLNNVATESQALSKQPIIIQDNSSRTNVGGGTTNQAIAMPPPNPFDHGDPFNGTRGLVISP